MAQVIPIRECPERSATETEANWYQLPNARDLSICSRCFFDYLDASPFASHFQLQYDPSNTSRYCDFNFPRMLVVLQQALEQNSFPILENYITYRSQIKRCIGGSKAEAKDNLLWYQGSGLNQSWTVCQACYEDHIVAANYASNFSREPIYVPSGKAFQCELGWKYCQRLLTSGKDWGTIVSCVSHRMSLPSCARSAETEAKSRKWFKLRPSDLNSLWMCEECYYDKASMTVLEQQVCQPKQPHGIKIKCFAGGIVPLVIAWNEALSRNDFGRFHHAARAFTQSPTCVPTGFKSDIWYSTSPPCAGFDVCPACYAGCFEATGLGHYLTLTTRSGLRTCDLNIRRPGTIEYFKKIELAANLRNPHILTDYVERYSLLPACTKGELVTNGHWYRHEMFAACPRCWIDVIEGTSLESCFFARNEVIPTLKCDFYSPRVRKFWNETCAAGNAGLPGFVSIMTQRLEIWKQTYPQIKQNHAKVKANMKKQSNLDFSGGLLSFGSALAEATGLASTPLSSGLDKFAELLGDKQGDTAAEMKGKTSGLVAQSAQLEKIWKSVE